MSTAVRQVPIVRRELPEDIEVWIDSGIMSGADIVTAIARGAAFTLIGRAYLYGLMAGGERRVARAIDIWIDPLVAGLKPLHEAQSVRQTHRQEASGSPVEVPAGVRRDAVVSVLDEDRSIAGHLPQLAHGLAVVDHIVNGTL